MIRRMPFQRPLILSIVASIFKDRADLVAENVALCHPVVCQKSAEQNRSHFQGLGACHDCRFLYHR
jgi:hypothetical protein